MAGGVRERIIEAAYECAARNGIAKTTVEDAARIAGVSRATVYRYFHGGRDELIREAVGWETGRFIDRLAVEVGNSESLTELLERSLKVASRMLDEHEVLQKVLATEPDQLLPYLTLESARVIDKICSLTEPFLEELELPPGTNPESVAGYLARMLLSFTLSPGGWDLRSEQRVKDLVRVELLGWMQPSGL